jgi:hypothetical protein
LHSYRNICSITGSYPYQGTIRKNNAALIHAAIMQYPHHLLSMNACTKSRYIDVHRAKVTKIEKNAIPPIVIYGTVPDTRSNIYMITNK